MVKYAKKVEGSKGYEAYRNRKQGQISRNGKNRRLRQMPSKLPVRLQNKLHCGQSGLRKK